MRIIIKIRQLNRLIGQRLLNDLPLLFYKSHSRAIKIRVRQMRVNVIKSDRVLHPENDRLK